MIDRRFGARIGLKRELGVLEVVNTSLGAASSGKVKKSRNTKRENNRTVYTIEMVCTK